MTETTIEINGVKYDRRETTETTTEQAMDNSKMLSTTKETEAFSTVKNNRLVIGVVAFIVLIMMPQLLPIALLLLIVLAILRYRVKGSL